MLNGYREGDSSAFSTHFLPVDFISVERNELESMNNGRKCVCETVLMQKKKTKRTEAKQKNLNLKST